MILPAAHLAAVRLPFPPVLLVPHVPLVPSGVRGHPPVVVPN